MSGLAGLVLAVAVLSLVAGKVTKLPNPNGYDRLVSIAGRIPEDVRDLPATNSVALAHFATEHSGLIGEVEDALKLPAAAPLAMGQEWFADQAAEFMSVRSLEKALLAVARHAEIAGDSALAVRGRLAVIELGQRIGRGGLLIHYFLSAAIQINGLKVLSNGVPQMDRAACQFALREIPRIQGSLEPLSGYLGRERRWLLTSSQWWRDWETAKQIPQSLVDPARGSFWGTPQQRARELAECYAGLERVLQRRIEGLTDLPESRRLP